MKLCPQHLCIWQKQKVHKPFVMCIAWQWTKSKQREALMPSVRMTVLPDNNVELLFKVQVHCNQLQKKHIPLPFVTHSVFLSLCTEETTKC